jgi:hypothetical protein
MRAEDYLMPKQGTLLLKSYVYLHIMTVPSCGIICYLVVMLHVKPT